MIIAAVPCPPLPLAGALGDHPRAVSSHVVLRLTMLDMAYSKPPAMQQRYLELKAAAEARLLAAIDALAARGGQQVCPDAAYPLFCSYMRDVLAASPVVAGAVAVLPMEHVLAGDAVHRDAVDHARAQDALFGGCAAGAAPYRELVALCATRVASARPRISDAGPDALCE